MRRASATRAAATLTRSEFAVARGAPARAGGAVRSRAQLLQAIYGDDAYRDPRNIDVHMSTICARSSRGRRRPRRGSSPCGAPATNGPMKPGLRAPFTGLRGRMSLALVVTSLATLAAAALVVVRCWSSGWRATGCSELRGLARTTRPPRCAAERRSTGPRRACSTRRAPAAPGGRADRRCTTAGAQAGRHGDRDARSAAPWPGEPRCERARRWRCAGRSVSPARTGEIAFAATVVRAEADRLTLVIAKRLDDSAPPPSVMRAALPRLARRRARGRGAPRGAAEPQPDAAPAAASRAEPKRSGTSGLRPPVAVDGADEVAGRRAGAGADARRLLAAERPARVASSRPPATNCGRRWRRCRRRSSCCARRRCTATRRPRAPSTAPTPRSARRTGWSRSPPTCSSSAARTAAWPRRSSPSTSPRSPPRSPARAAAGSRPAGGRSPWRAPVSVRLADPGAVARIVAILLDNADRHGAGEIRVEVGRDDGGILLAVEDDGPGLEPATASARSRASSAAARRPAARAPGSACRSPAASRSRWAVASTSPTARA